MGIELIPHVSQHLLRTLLIHAVQLTVVFAPLYRPITPLANVAEILSCNMSYPSCNLSLMLLIPHVSQHLLRTLLIHAVQLTVVFAPLYRPITPLANVVGIPFLQHELSLM